VRRLRTVLLLSAPLLLAASAAIQLVAAVPVPALTAVATLTDVRLPGPDPVLAWPAGASSALEVQGVASFQGHDATRPVPIGSVAKIMTAYLVLRSHPLTAHQDGPTLTVTAADAADYRSRAHTGQSLLPVIVGQRLSERQALQALLIPSANNTATLLARWQHGTVALFVADMNRTARSLGLAATRYTDPSGYDAATVSTAADQTRLAAAALADPTFADLVAERHVRLPGLGDITNYNTLLGSLGVVGVKTGSTDAAGGNLVFAARRTIDGQTVTFIGAVLGVDIGAPPLQALASAIADVRTALTQAETAVHLLQALPAGTTVATLRPSWSRPLGVITSTPIRVLGWAGLHLQLHLQPRPVHPGAADQAAGCVQVTVSSRQGPSRAVGNWRSDVRLAEPLPTPGLSWRLHRAF
jgi:D-alanyl-D-alanine carboxypeptidase (penicillin-binding protein 5/6)